MQCAHDDNPHDLTLHCVWFSWCCCCCCRFVATLHTTSGEDNQLVFSDDSTLPLDDLCAAVRNLPALKVVVVNGSRTVPILPRMQGTAMVIGWSGPLPPPQRASFA